MGTILPFIAKGLLPIDVSFHIRIPSSADPVAILSPLFIASHGFEEGRSVYWFFLYSNKIIIT